jgi:hypothetical protein
MKSTAYLTMLVFLAASTALSQAVLQGTNSKGTMVTIIGGGQSQAQQLASDQSSGSDDSSGYMSMTSGGVHHYNVGPSSSSSYQQQQQPQSPVRVISPPPQPIPVVGTAYTAPSVNWTGNNSYDAGGGISYVVQPSAKTRLSSLYGSLSDDDFDDHQWKQAARADGQSQALTSTKAIREAKAQGY